MLKRRGIIDLVPATGAADVLLPLGLALLLALSACVRRGPPSGLPPEATGVKEVDLAFETLEQTEWGSSTGRE